jgi:Na+/proline symporter
MHLSSLLALAQSPNASAFDPMLRLIGIAAIVYAFFQGIKSLGLFKPDSAQTPAPPPAPASTQSLQTPATSIPEGIAPEIIAVITAAVVSSTGSLRRIVSIKSPCAHWEKAGRQSVLTSHKIR